ncbi:S41 family peptidase [Acrocarpospora sp. B8E8]|uniref:S41 family peptidase n=1 Tax=Acrocarpospora sp. B8E8 TaxID=3153572 RepID=UPI00325DEA50
MPSGDIFDPAAMAVAAAAAPVPEAAPEPTPVWTLIQGLTLREFLSDAGELTLDERRVIVEQSLLVLEQNYAHLPLKIAMHGVNPLQRLKLLRAKLDRPGTPDPELAFHAEMLSIFHSVRDLHTLYLLPEPFNNTAAALPFVIEEAADGTGGTQYLVSSVDSPTLVPAEFVPGVVVTHWNGIPIARAVELNGSRYTGGNPAARHRRALATLTSRSLVVHLPPDEEWVDIHYIDLDGKPQQFSMEWLVLRRIVPPTPPSGSLPQGFDLEGQEVASIRAFLNPPAKAAEASPSAYQATGKFLWREVATSTGTYGHIRITGFQLGEFATDAAFQQVFLKFLNDFVAIATHLPEAGLIIDIRNNPGGVIAAGETLLQFLTPKKIQPESAQMLCSPLNLRLARESPRNYGQWAASLEQSVETGAVYSDAFTLTAPTLANAFGQFYHGPVVLITDARCYSTADIFAAGFADHEIGEIIGTDGNTGAGGGNVVDHTDLRKALREPYENLPRGAGMTLAIRRMLRVGGSAGVPLEDLGVLPSVRHQLTAADVLHGNQDLMERAGSILHGKPVRRLRLTAVPGDASLTVTLDTLGLDRADLYVDGRPRGSYDIAAGESTVVVPDMVTATEIRAEGFLGKDLVAVARTFLD